jgi:hypothetical protein
MTKTTAGLELFSTPYSGAESPKEWYGTSETFPLFMEPYEITNESRYDVNVVLQQHARRIEAALEAVRLQHRALETTASSSRPVAKDAAFSASSTLSWSFVFVASLAIALVRHIPLFALVVGAALFGTAAIVHLLVWRAGRAVVPAKMAFLIAASVLIYEALELIAVLPTSR